MHVQNMDTCIEMYMVSYIKLNKFKFDVKIRRKDNFLQTISLKNLPN